jgi:transposase
VPGAQRVPPSEEVPWLRARVAELEAGNGETATGAAPGRSHQPGPVRARGAAMAALAVCANCLPVARAARLIAALTAVNVSAGFVAGVRGKAPSQLDPFMDRVRALLRQAQVLYADETPARADGKLRYVHVACTEFLTALHTGGRSAKAFHWKFKFICLRS